MKKGIANKPLAKSQVEITVNDSNRLGYNNS